MKRKLLLFTLSLIALPMVLLAEGETRLTRGQYIDQWKDEAIYQMVVYKIPASITLAQGILESADGNSRLAREANNHFGIKCHSDWTGKKAYHDDDRKGECFRVYNDARESYEDHSVFLQKQRYAPLFELKIDDYKGWAKGLKKCGYATNSQYADLLIRIIEENGLDEYDKEGVQHIKKGHVPDNRTPSPVAVNSSKKEKEKKERKGRNDRGSDIPNEVNLASNRSVKISDNRIKYIIAKSGDDIFKICEDLDMMPWQIRRYNDLSTGHQFEEGELVYLQPKRGKASKATEHVVQEGESLWDISQSYGIKMKKLQKLNALSDNADVKPGSRLKLR